MLDRFTYFIQERHNVYLRRRSGAPAPWSNDPMLRDFKFTNIYRELDRTTIWCKKNVRDIPHESLYHQAMAILAFRFFNRIKTGEAIFNTAAWKNYMSTGNTVFLKCAILEFCGRGPYVTGAYIIKTVNGMNKIDGALWSIRESKTQIRKLAAGVDTLAKAQAILLDVPYLGNFMAAQLIADMKYTPLLNKATDWHTWAASGPGSRRGLNLLCGRDEETNWKEDDWLTNLDAVRREILPVFDKHGWESPHAQDVQNMLCEFSKYYRGYSRNRFQPSGSLP